MKILVINAGSSSLKYQLISMTEEKTMAKGVCERIGIGGRVEGRNCNGVTFGYDIDIPDHTAAFLEVEKALTSGKAKVIDSLNEIVAVGHRVVQGGAIFNSSVLITDDVLTKIEELSDLAPLHNPAHVQGIRACKKVFGPEVPQVAVFDNAFHSTMPPEAYMFPIPYEYYEKYNIRRYGFHGIAFRSMAEEVDKILNETHKNYKIVNLMLGSGTTANALKYGKSVEVSTGFTPHEGLIQSTRAGDIDAAAILYLMKKENLSIEQADELINKKSGWKGLSGISNDMREIYQASQSGNERAKLTIDAVCHRFKKYVGAYSAIMEGIDILVFSGGVGQNAPYIREKVCKGLEYMGIELDEYKNQNTAGIISKDSSKVKVIVVNANEEKIIAQDTYEICK